MAHITETLNPLPVQTAIDEIKYNMNVAFRWFVVKNKTGAIFEIGGTAKEMKIYVPYYNEDGTVKKHPNNMIHSNFCLYTGKAFIHPADGLNLDMKKFLKNAINTDFRKVKFTPGSSTEIIYRDGVSPKITRLK